MDEDVLKKVCNFLQSEKEKEVFFPKFWDGTKEFYPPGMSKTKVKAWLKQHNERFEIIASEKGDPFGKVKLKVETTSSDLPATSKNQDKKITQKLIECIDNTAENGHLFAIICKNKAQIFPEKLQDKKHIRKWLTEHEDCFKMVNDANGGLFSVEVLDKARNLRKGRSLPPARSEGKTTHEDTRPLCQKQEGPSGFNLMQMADNIAQKISEKIKNEGPYVSFDLLLEAKDVIYPLSDAGSLQSFLESFSSKFEIIVVEGLGQWVHLKNSDDAIGNVTRFIFKNGGTVPFDELLKNAVRLIDVTVNTPEALSVWLRGNAGVYEVFPKPDNPSQLWQVKVKLAFAPRFCQNYVTRGQCEKRNCQFLHICKAFICQPQHSNEACELSHHVRDAHNKVIVDRMGALINKESDDVVLKVLSKSCFPRVCSVYNNRNGECKNGDKCHFLHICGNYVLNQCSGHCQLSHQVADGRHNIELLKRYAMLPSKNMSEEIVKTNIAFAQVKKIQPDQSVGEQERFAQAAKPPQMFKSQIHDQSLEVSSREKKKRHRPRRRKRKSDQASSTMDDGSSAETDSTAGDFDNQSIASSTDNTKQSLLSSDNIQKSNLATSLTGHQKVESWMGSPVREPYPAEAADESCKQSDSSSDVSHPTSIVSTRSSFWQGDLQKKVFITILEKYNGSVMFSRIVKERDLFSRDINIVNWFESFPQTFILHRNGQGKIDSVSAFSRKSRLCLDYSGKHGCVKPSCGFFHICRDHVEGHCRGGNTCPRNHDFNHEQVTEAAKSMGLHDLTQSQLHPLIRVSIPAVCHFHNHGRCNRGVFCPNLHICKKFARGHCSAKACKLGHQEALKQNPAKKILNMYQLWSKQPNLKYIQKMIFVFDTRKQSGDQTGEGRASENQSENLETTDEVRVVSGLMDIDLTEKVDNTVQETEEVAPIICSKFLLGQRHKKCRDFHFGLPYCWQFKSPGGSWNNFDKSDCENIEKYFCDVNCTATELSISTQIAGVTSSVRLDFQSMSGQTSTGDGFKVRRLECQAKEQVESEAWYLTQWKWYKLESTKWMEQANEVSLLDVIEGKIDRSSLRRRPAVFITESQVDEKKRAQQEQQSSEAPLSPTPGSPVSREPPQSSSDPVRENIPPQPEPASADCHRTRVEQGSKDYREVEKLLLDCVGQTDVVVNHIERIVSDDLWEKHKSKKKSMTDELRPGEHLNEHRLFVPCLYEDLERITRGNIHLSRIDVPKPLGPGHYFTSDASLCLEMCRENFTQSRFLIVCQVLLGTYTHASPGLTELPRRPDGRFYDSLVDKNDDPTVFVLQEKDLDQCYPAFILDFSYTPTSPQNEVDGTLRSSEGNHGLTTQPQQFYPNVSQPLPAYQPDPPRLPASTHPLSTGYAPGSTNLSSVVPQQPHMTPNIPTSPDYVKVAPPYSERPPLPSDPPPGYTPLPQSTSTVSADLHNPRNVRRTPASPTSRPPKNPKECLVM